MGCGRIMEEENKPKPAKINRLYHNGQAFLCLEDLLMALQSEINFVGDQTKTYIENLCQRLEKLI